MVAVNTVKMAETVASAPPGRPGRRGRRPIPWLVYVVLIPTFVVLGVISYYPAFSGIWHSFYGWHPGFTSTFTGLANYRQMLHDDLWWSSFKNLGIIFIASVTVMWVLPIVAAELVIIKFVQFVQFVWAPEHIKAWLAATGAVPALTDIKRSEAATGFTAGDWGTPMVMSYPDGFLLGSKSLAHSSRPTCRACGTRAWPTP